MTRERMFDIRLRRRLIRGGSAAWWAVVIVGGTAAALTAIELVRLALLVVGA